jgi:aminoglycoside 6'-N-acetyltransferase
MEKIELIKFVDDENNYKLMHKWCSNDFVYEWFEQRVLSFDEIKNKYKNKLMSGEQDMYIMVCDDTPIGYVQIYKNDESYEYDLFIGEEDYLHRGIGSRVVKMINDLIYEKYKVDHIVLRPFKRNVGAVNCYKKNGFEIIDEYEDEDTLGNKEIYLLMINKK